MKLCIALNMQQIKCFCLLAIILLYGRYSNVKAAIQSCLYLLQLNRYFVPNFGLY